jgi:hypothetical protein
VKGSEGKSEEGEHEGKTSRKKGEMEKRVKKMKKEK